MATDSGAVPAAAFDSRAVAPPVRVGLWEKATARFLVPMRISAPGQSIVGVIGTRRIGSASFCRLSATPHTALRSGELASGPGAGHYKVAIGLHGRSMISQHGRRVSLGPGDMTVYDTSEEYSVRSDVPFGLLVALLPQELVDLSPERVAAVAATGLVGEHAAPARSGLLALASAGADAPALDEVAAAVRRLVRGARPARVQGRRDAAALLERAVAVIHDRLGDPGLTPDHVAAVVGVSRRYLYALFAAEVGPIAQYVRTLRLEHARHLLQARPDVPVSEVALECGFPDPAHFSRLFRSAYGTPPRAFRRTARG
ncbi:helix-turn-helix domain-containing protein [Geodermatophilus ruber]|uniref:Transcriptional regulator, AraC family n=1 Tax=Geodermatophilus ruber TaxID=504800 RepID=A0A1I4DYP1_9ACTN|nr:helix-turn-helix domain-containing protein [Geodermatophilus ruber]SFK98565.1 transcriptional regulator, AraC family [Geodermatophilus ruber]